MTTSPTVRRRRTTLQMQVRKKLVSKNQRRRRRRRRLETARRATRRRRRRTVRLNSAPLIFLRRLPRRPSRDLEMIINPWHHRHHQSLKTHLLSLSM